MSRQGSSAFGAELRRPFEVYESCYGCVELHNGCNAWRQSRPFACADYFPLPDVGVNGATGQDFPPSRMGSRKEPRARTGSAETVKPNASRKDANSQRPPQAGGSSPTRRQSPVSSRGLDGGRLCGCGATLKKRHRCCEVCRLQRRQETMHNRRRRERTSTTAEPARLPTQEQHADGVESMRTINLTRALPLHALLHQ
jgi:hypothetical protein